ncbi:MAG: large conductance mechanosensitive channel protein MscL [Chloroflexi bacterium]|nr:large conductance mechanosensitive channel protein MscL [Chloroflexota bacterium]
MFEEFKKFVMRGNVLDLAVGVIIGGAFGKIVASLVGDILMPLIGLLLGGVDFSGLAIMVGKAEVKYGAFIQTVIDFLIIALVIFLIVRMANAVTTKPEASKAPTDKDCPYCLSKVPLKATKCAYCASALS